MRWLLACAAVLLAGLAMASPLDLLGRIERAILYPFDSTRVSPSDIGLPQITETISETGPPCRDLFPRQRRKPRQPRAPV